MLVVGRFLSSSSYHPSCTTLPTIPGLLDTKIELKIITILLTITLGIHNVFVRTILILHCCLSSLLYSVKILCLFVGYYLSHSSTHFFQPSRILKLLTDSKKIHSAQHQNVLLFKRRQRLHKLRVHRKPCSPNALTFNRHGLPMSPLRRGISVHACKGRQM